MTQGWAPVSARLAERQVAQFNLKLDKLYVVYPGEHRFTLVTGIEVVPLWALLPQG